ncbi:MAG: NADH-quinone oxidoreductase subunit K [Candidatus Margulisiibacteriota bacterium]
MGIEMSQLFWIVLTFFILMLIEGFYCITMTYNLLRVLIGLEILIKAVTLFIIFAGYISGNMSLAQAVVITVIVIEVVVVVIATGIILGFFREYDSLNVRNARNMKG